VSRFAEHAYEQLDAFIQDATTGLVARIVDIQAADRENDTLLPTTGWTFVGHGKKQRKLPAVVIFRDPRSTVAQRRRGTQPYEYMFYVVLLLGYAVTKGDPDTEDRVLDRLDWVLRETFDETVRWKGHKLSTSSNVARVHDAYLKDVVTDGIPALPDFNEKKRSVYAAGAVRVTIVENQTHP